ncbi:unnamed protein product [Amoebophrya sp. A25]|nr:unnamed protein product [Amoebophrya sp. A25]|eukprot:GSA25T00009743001.1
MSEGAKMGLVYRNLLSVTPLKEFLMRFGFSLQRTLKQFGDNRGAIKHVTGSQPVARLKHIVIRSAYIKELINTGEVQVFFLESAKNRSNVLSKICRGIEFKRGLLQLKLLQVEAIDAEAE